MTVDFAAIEGTAQAAGELELEGRFTPCPERRGAIVSLTAGLADDPDLLAHKESCPACAGALAALEDRLSGAEPADNPPELDLGSPLEFEPAEDDLEPALELPPLPPLRRSWRPRLRPRAPRPRQRRRVEHLGLVVATAFVVLTAVLGAFVALGALGGSGSKPGAAAKSGPLTIPLRPPWRITASRSAGNLLRQPIALSSSGATLLAGWLSKPGLLPGDPPPGLVASLGRPARIAPTTVSGRRALRYLWHRRGHGDVAAVVIPTTTRTDLAIICARHGGPADGLDRCLGLAASARIAGVSSPAPGLDRKLAAAIKAELGPALAARAQFAPTAAQPRALADAADALARVELPRSAALMPRAPTRDEVMVSELSGAIKAEAFALSNLSVALRSRDGFAYGRATRDLSDADRRLEAISRALASRGQGLPVLAPLRLSQTFPVAHPPRKPKPRAKAKRSPATPRLPSPAPHMATSTPTVKPLPIVTSPVPTPSPEDQTDRQPHKPPPPRTVKAHPLS